MLCFRLPRGNRYGLYHFFADHLRRKYSLFSFHWNRLSTFIAPMALNGQSRNLHIVAGMFSSDYLCIAEKTPLLVRYMLVNFQDILPETSQSSASWDMGVT